MKNKKEVKLIKKILNYYEGHNERMGYDPKLTACELKAEFDLDYKDIKFMFNGNGIKNEKVESFKKLKIKVQKRTKLLLIKLGIKNKSKLKKYLLSHNIESLLEVKNFGRKSLSDLRNFCILNEIKYTYKGV